MEKENKEINGEKGVGINVFHYEELIMPAFFEQMEPEKRLKMIREFKHRKGDILLCSYPKTGTHWLSHLVYFLVTPGSVQPVPPTLMELIPCDLWKEVEKSKVLSSHMRINRQPIEHLEQGGKIIIITRDPRDAMVSMKYHVESDKSLSNGSIPWNSFFDSWMNGKCPFGSYFDYYNSWEQAIKENKDLNVLIVHFEHLKTNGLKELQRIQDFLEVSNSEERLGEILDRCSVKKMQENVDAGKVLSPLKDKDGKSFLYRKGDIGDWKNHFTVAQSEYFDRVSEEKFKDSIFKL